MQAGVPFVLLGVVQLLSVAGWLGLAGAACFPRLLRRTTPVFVVGAVALALADGLTAVDFGASQTALVSALRAGGLLVVALGLAGRVLQPSVGAAAVVVVPLGTPLAPAAIAAAAGVVGAAAALLRGRRRDRAIAALLAATCLLTGAAAAGGVAAAHDSVAAVVVLALRAAGAVAALAVPAVLARRSVLARVVAAILGGVLVMAAGTVGVVGPGIADQVQQEGNQQVAQVAKGQLAALQDLRSQTGLLASVVAACPDDLQRCAALLQLFSTKPGWFAARVRADGDAAQIAGSPLSTTALQQVATDPAVRQALKSGHPQTTVTVLPGHEPTVALLGAAPTGERSGSRVGIYGIRLTDAYARAAQSQTNDDLSLLVDGRVLASSLPAGQRAEVRRAATRAGAGAGQPVVGAGRLVEARGDAPTVMFLPVVADNDDHPVATLAVSQPARAARAAQRNVLQRAFLTAVVAMVVVSIGGLVLARRIVDPLRRLTVAARRIRRGDLTTETGIGGQDEVAALSRAFDSMTVSVRTMNQELRQAATEEASLRARLETVLASMSDGLLTADPAGRVTQVNPAAAALLAVPATGALGRPLVEVADLRGPDGAPLRLESAEKVEASALALLPAGGAVPVRVAAAPLADGSGTVVVLRDMRREREIERMKTEFLSNVSHELRTPLTPIKGYAEILRRRPQVPPERSASYLDNIIESADRMGRVVDLLVDVAAIEAGRVVPAPRPVEVGPFVDSLLTQWRQRWPQRAGDLRRRVAGGLPPIEIDPEWVGKALGELADNAVKYTAPGTAVTLAASRGASGLVRLVVRDAGSGIPAGQLPELLADFAQADGSETRRVGGMGLGLSFVRRLAQAFGLPLVAGSDVGKGSEFGFDLPAAEAAPPPRRVEGARSGRAT